MTAPRIEWIHLDAAQGALCIGDVVSAAAGGLPIYRVVALTDREAWVRDEGRVEVQRMPISRLYWKAAEVCPNGVNG